MESKETLDKVTLLSSDILCMSRKIFLNISAAVGCAEIVYMKNFVTKRIIKKLRQKKNFRRKIGDN